VKFFGFEVTRRKAQALSAVDSRGGWFSLIRESFAGAWQSMITVDAPKELLAFSAVFACVTVIARDISKLQLKLTVEEDDGICVEADSKSPFWAVLRKPNKYQNRIKFIEQWIVSKLLYGNTYVLKQRDARGVVNALYILDPQRVTPLVATNGDVYYQLSRDDLSRVDGPITVPASEIIHDMMVSLWHPLVGVSPIYACGMSATMGNRIQKNSTKFFDNMSRPSGLLTAPATISDEVAARLKAHWEQNFTGENIGRLAVLGDGLKYEAMTIPANEAQLIEQLKWTVEDVARCFHVPLYKLGGPAPAYNNIEALNQGYYSDCLQAPIEAAELCLDEGLGLPSGYYTEFDLDGLLRMDTAARYEAKNKAIGGGWMSPNEARKGENLKPVKGGESPLIQVQNYSLAALAKRDAKEDPFATTPAPSAPAPSKDSKDKPAAEDDSQDEQVAARNILASFKKQLFAEFPSAHG
jgi:HK97 family phage portal protein